MLSQSLQNPVVQLKTPLNPAGFRLTLAPNVSRPIIPWRQATALTYSLLERIRCAGSGPLDHKDGSTSLDRGAIRERRCCWLCSAARPPLTSWKSVVIGPKRKPSSGWAVELRHFFCLVCSVFCERAGSVFLHRLLYFLWTCWLCIFASFALFFASFFLFYTNVKWPNL